jgi:hypothetical protein
MIPKQPRRASDAQKQRIREYAAVTGETVENLVCRGSRYRTSSLEGLYSYEAVALISALKTTVTQ